MEEVKTPKQMAEEYGFKFCWSEDSGWAMTMTRDAFLAGYQAAKDQLADADKVMPQWISVKDRLPKEDVDVAIGWFQKTASNKTYWTVDAAQLTNKVFSGWRVYPEVTHWMPLPKPPEE